jgi:hypothetical protein
MPEISRFLGVVVHMYLLDHPPPHFHARYGDWSSQVGIAPARLLRGRLPPRVLALVVEWATLHEAELEANWRRLQTDEPPRKIAPLE